MDINNPMMFPTKNMPTNSSTNQKSCNAGDIVTFACSRLGGGGCIIRCKIRIFAVVKDK